MEAVAASVDITPARLLPTACHGPFNTPSEGIALPFEANMIALRENGVILVVVSLDWIFTSPGLRSRILERCEGTLADTNLFVAASHAHTSPATDRTKIGFSAVDNAYLARSEGIIADAVNELLRSAKWTNAKLRYAGVPCDCCVQRRRKILQYAAGRIQRKVARYPNKEGPRDRELRLLRVEDEAGNLLSVIWGVSCHPTDWPRLRELSSDYPGAVRQALRIQVGRDLPIVFLQGFCGDLRPPSIGLWRRTGPWHRRFLLLANTLVNGPCFAGFTATEYQAWQSGITECARKGLAESANAPALATNLAFRRSSVPLSSLGLSGEISTITCHWFDLAEQLRVTGISAEPCWEYMQMVQRIFPGKVIWPVGYIDNVFGYLPTRAMLSEGGYEVTEFRKRFGINGEFVQNLEEVIEKLVLC